MVVRGGAMRWSGRGGRAGEVGEAGGRAEGSELSRVWYPGS